MTRFATSTVQVLAAVVFPVVAASGQGALAPSKYPFLFRFQHEGATHHLFGTIHSNEERITTLSESVRLAIDGADTLLAELDLDHISEYEGLRARLLPGDQNLSDILDEATRKALDDACAKVDGNRMVVDRFKPWGAMVYLDSMDAIRTYGTGMTDDWTLWDRARAAGKTLSGLEVLTEQLSAFDRVSRLDQIKLMAISCQRVNRDETHIQQGVYDAYYAGDSRRLAKARLAFFGKDRALRDRFDGQLIVHRNAHMVERLTKRLEESPETSVFCAVGVLHLIGETGMVESLRKRGYKVTRIDGKGEKMADNPPEEKPASQKSKER